MPMTKGSRSGMQGVFLVAAELTGRGFIVSVTSRNAFGADLLVTDQDCLTSWSVQVKTNGERNSYWLLNRTAKEHKSPSHVYVFVNLKGKAGVEYYVVPSADVSDHVYVDSSPSGNWYSYDISDAKVHLNAWTVFGDPEPKKRDA
jgi:hypothetical protein